VKQATVFGIPSPWSGDERDPIGPAYRAWFIAYRTTRRLRHRVGVHDWNVIDIDKSRRCTWCGKVDR
jgi:hypothetical protein